MLRQTAAIARPLLEMRLRLQLPPPMKTIEEEFSPESKVYFEPHLAEIYTRLRARAAEMELELAVLRLEKFIAPALPPDAESYQPNK